MTLSSGASYGLFLSTSSPSTLHCYNKEHLSRTTILMRHEYRPNCPRYCPVTRTFVLLCEWCDQWKLIRLPDFFRGLLTRSLNQQCLMSDSIRMAPMQPRKWKRAPQKRTPDNATEGRSPVNPPLSLLWKEGRVPASVAVVRSKDCGPPGPD